MRQMFIGAEEVVAPFMRDMLDTPGGFYSGRGLGVFDVLPGMDPPQAKILAGIWFDYYTGANMMIHVAAQPGSRWMSKQLLWYTFYYPFVECGCRRLTGMVAESNHAARAFDERMGFKLEGRMKDAAPDGDVLIYAMFREDCRWLSLVHKIPEIRSRIN